MASTKRGTTKKVSSMKLSNIGKSGLFSFLVLGTILVAALVIFLVAGTNNGEGKLVDKTNLQAVTLSNGQVYYGTIKSISADYVVINNVFTRDYSVGGTEATAPLQRIGCSAHAPQDQMTINRSQVSYWENLKEDSPVSTAIKDFATSGKDACTQIYTK